MSLIKLLSYVLLISLFFSCRKKENSNGITNSELTTGILVLNEGLFNLNNASLSWIDKTNGTINGAVFEQNAGRLLGDTGNDMLRYGSKLYIVVNVSSTIEILDARSLKSIKQIAMLNNGIAKQPRNCIASNGKIYVSCFDGYVDVIDTTTLLIEKRIKVGTNPESLLIKDNVLLVSNSGGLNGPKMDSTISVVDLSTQNEINKLVVGTNPGRIVDAHNDDIYVIVRGNYQQIPSRLKRVNISEGKVVKSFDFDIADIVQFEQNYLIKEGGSSSIALFSSKEETIVNSTFINLNPVKTYYRIQCVENQKRIVVLDANNFVNTGYLFEYNFSGELLNKYHVGLNPNTVIYYE
jgi:hypothetical protein